MYLHGTFCHLHLTIQHGPCAEVSCLLILLSLIRAQGHVHN